MKNSQLFDDARSARLPDYECSVDKPVYMQMPQAVVFDKKQYGDTEVPIYYQTEEEIKVTVGGFLCMLFLQMIPVVGIVLLFVWAFSKDDNYVRRTFSRALLIFYGVAAVVAGLSHWAFWASTGLL